MGYRKGGKNNALNNYPMLLFYVSLILINWSYAIQFIAFEMLISWNYNMKVLAVGLYTECMRAFKRLEEHERKQLNRY